MSKKTITLDADDIDMLRNVLLIGLDGIGELQRLKNAEDLADLCKHTIPEGMRQLDVNPDAETVSKFAGCLRLLG